MCSSCKIGVHWRRSHDARIAHQACAHGPVHRTPDQPAPWPQPRSWRTASSAQISAAAAATERRTSEAAYLRMRARCQRVRVRRCPRPCLRRENQSPGRRTQGGAVAHGEGAYDGVVELERAHVLRQHLRQRFKCRHARRRAGAAAGPRLRAATLRTPSSSSPGASASTAALYRCARARGSSCARTHVAAPEGPRGPGSPRACKPAGQGAHREAVCGRACSGGQRELPAHGLGYELAARQQRQVLREGVRDQQPRVLRRRLAHARQVGRHGRARRPVRVGRPPGPAGARLGPRARLPNSPGQAAERTRTGRRRPRRARRSASRQAGAPPARPPLLGCTGRQRLHGRAPGPALPRRAPAQRGRSASSACSIARWTCQKSVRASAYSRLAVRTTASLATTSALEALRGMGALARSRTHQSAIIVREHSRGDPRVLLPACCGHALRQRLISGITHACTGLLSVDWYTSKAHRPVYTQPQLAGSDSCALYVHRARLSRSRGRLSISESAGVPAMHMVHGACMHAVTPCRT